MTLSEMLPSLRSSIPPRLTPQLWPRTAHTAPGREVVVGGVGLTALAAAHGTPTYVLDEAEVRSACRDYRHAFHDGEVAYAAKAFLNRAVAHWINGEALSLDVCSAGELAIARSAGFPTDRVILHGNVKTAREWQAAAEVGRIVVDSANEIPLLAATQQWRRRRVLIRVTPNVDTGGPAAVTTGVEDQKFGFSVGSGAAFEAARRVCVQPRLELAGLHAHLGSQILDPTGYELALRRMLELAAAIRQRCGVTIGELNVGGGHGIAYQAGDRGLDVADLARRLRWLVRDRSRALRLPTPRLTVEPGRGIIGRAMVALYRVHVVKRSTHSRTFVAVDGGMSDNLRPALYGAHYSVRLVGRTTTAPEMVATVVGRNCEPGDVLAHDVVLPTDLRAGDLLAMPTAGAYQLAMASNYNGLPRPAVVAVHGGRSRVVTRAETDADLIRRDVSV